MSSRHAEHGDEYRRLACVASPRLLASRFASQFSDSYRSRQRSLVSLNAGVTVVRVIGRRCFCAHSVDICVEARQVVVPQGTAALSRKCTQQPILLRACRVEPGCAKSSGVRVSEPSESATESTNLAWEHLYSSSSPGLRRWLTTGQPWRFTRTC